MADPAPPKPPGQNRFLEGLLRGVRLRCPDCGRGRLYAAYLKVDPTCPVCGHDNAQYRTDDAAPYFTILLVGHLAIGSLLFLPFIHTAPLWVVLITTIPGLAVLTLALLPVVKGGVVGALWSIGLNRDPAKPAAAGRETGVVTLEQV